MSRPRGDNLKNSDFLIFLNEKNSHFKGSQSSLKVDSFVILRKNTFTTLTNFHL